MANGQQLCKTENVDFAFSGFIQGLRPPPNITISEWAEKNRILAGAASSEPGLWSNERTPYLVEIMDNLSPQSPVTDVVFMKGAQVGGTECLINTALYYVCHSPCPIGMFQTTETTAKRFLKQRIAPAFSSMHMENIFTGDDMYMREFPGGVMVTGWSNSPSNLRSMPLKIVLCDEISGWARDCGGEGDPCSLVAKRSSTFPRRKMFWNSTPTIEGECRVTDRFKLSDQRFYNVPCPSCGQFHKWEWSNMVWDKGEDGAAKPHTARMKCPHCGHEYGEYKKTELMAKGRWIAENPHGNCPGYNLNALYSPLGWFSWERAVIEFLEAQGDNNKLKAFTNNVLAQAWSIEDTGKQIDNHELMARCEDYGCEVPDGVVLLTLGGDTQDDRIEVEVRGWGKGLESWGIHSKIFYGDPNTDAPWQQLEEWLDMGFVTSDGEVMFVAGGLLDSQGHRTDAVYRWTMKNQWRRIYPCMGARTRGKPICSRPHKTEKSGNLMVVSVGTDTTKDWLFGALQVQIPGATYCHFPNSDEYDAEYFAQLTGEKLKKVWKRGAMSWEYVKTRPRNEALDKFVYSRAAVNLCGATEELDKMADVGYRYTRKPTQPGKVVAGHQSRRVLNGGVRV